VFILCTVGKGCMCFYQPVSGLKGLRPHAVVFYTSFLHMASTLGVCDFVKS